MPHLVRRRRKDPMPEKCKLGISTFCAVCNTSVNEDKLRWARERT